MATIEQFKQVRASVSPEVQTELFGLLVQDLDAAVQKMIAIGAGNNVSFTAEEVKSYLQDLGEEDEFDDLELNEAALAAVSGGKGWGKPNPHRVGVSSSGTPGKMITVDGVDYWQPGRFCRETGEAY